MVRLTKIYTRSGDAGETSLADGTRVKKYSLRPEAYGTVDETNSVIGLARLYTDGNPQVDAMLARIQNDLFDLGADLAMPETKNPKRPPLRIDTSQVKRLEREIDAMNENLKPLDSFILPGGRPAAAYLHLARSVARRAERAMVALAEEDAVSVAATKFVNRLSDHLFVLARHINDNGAGDVLWVPGKNR